MLKDWIETKTLVTALIISLFGWILSKLYSFFDIKIKRIDSIEQLKKDFELFKIEYIEDNKELKE